MTPCPQCGSPSELGLVRVYCTNSACEHADKPAEQLCMTVRIACAYNVTERVVGAELADMCKSS